MTEKLTRFFLPINPILDCNNIKSSFLKNKNVKKVFKNVFEYIF